MRSVWFARGFALCSNICHPLCKSLTCGMASHKRRSSSVLVCNLSAVNCGDPIGVPNTLKTNGPIVHALSVHTVVRLSPIFTGIIEFLVDQFCKDLIKNLPDHMKSTRSHNVNDL